MVRWGFRLKGNCPFCLQEDETTAHIITCQHPDAKTVWNKSMKKWFQSLIKIGIDPTIITGIRDEVNAWKTGLVNNIVTGDDGIDNLLAKQRKIGWQQFLEGLLSTEWYNFFIKDSDTSRYQANTIISRIIRANWEFTFSIWTERNSKLHDTDRIKEFEGRPNLIQAIKDERKVGLSILPHNDFGYLFTIKEGSLLSRTLEGLKDWLAIVRGGRELFKDPRTPQDLFSQQGTLRSWIGLQGCNTRTI